MTEKPFPILVVTAERIGEAVLSSGLIRRLHDEIPRARFTIVAGAAALPLFCDTPGLERLIPLPAPRFGPPGLALWRQVRGRRWGLVVDLHGPGLARALSTRRRAVRRPAPAGAAPLHKVLEAARVLRVEDDPPAPYLFTGPETDAAADRLLDPKTLGASPGPILAIAPAAGWVGKTWPSERFAVLAAGLLDDRGPMAGGRLLLLGGTDDRWISEAVRRVIPRERLIDAVGRTDILTAYAALKRARLFVGNDTGLMHLAAAAGAPTLGLFGPSDERVYAPWGPHARALRGPRDLDTLRRADPELNLAVCHMMDLPTEWVVDAARRLLEETAGRFAPSAAPPAFEAPLPPSPSGSTRGSPAPARDEVLGSSPRTTEGKVGAGGRERRGDG